MTALDFADKSPCLSKASGFCAHLNIQGSEFRSQRLLLLPLLASALLSNTAINKAVPANGNSIVSPACAM